MASDYRDAFGHRKPSQTAEDRRWWLLEARKAANAVTSTLLSLKQMQTQRLRQLTSNARLYGHLSLLGPLSMAFAPQGVFSPPSPGRSSFNVVASCVDTITSKIAKASPDPLFLTSAGSFAQQRRAQKLTAWTQGVIYENGGHNLSVAVFKDSCVWGSGIIHVYGQDGRVCLERVHPMEIIVDEAQAIYGKPSQLHRVKAVDRDQLIQQFPEFEQDLRNIDSAKLETVTYGLKVSDLLEVRASWHLPSGPDAEDGRYMITVGELVLLSEPWEHQWFPFAKMDYSSALYGWWGKSLVEQLAPLQLEVNMLSFVATQSYRKMGSYKVLVKIGSKVVDTHLNDEIGTIINYSGDTPPTYVVPPAVNPDLLNRIETLKHSAFELAGISQLAATSTKPAGLNSGAALREYNDTTSDRFSVTAQAYEQLFVDLAHLIVRTSRDMEEVSSVRVPGKKALTRVEWAQAQMDEDSYVLRVFPISSLPDSPAGRLQTVSELVQAGMISPDRGRKLLAMPDLAADEGLENAQQDYLIRLLDNIVDNGLYTPPEPQDNLAEARKLALQFYAQAKASDLEPERQQMLRDFLSQIDELEALAQPPQPAGPGATPQAQPMAAPQSDLVPNAPGIPGI